MDKGTKLVFDDDGVAHPLYELQDEEDFKQEGPAEQLRREFVEAEANKVREADLEDKELAKKRRKEKRDRQKARERVEMATAQGLPQLGTTDRETEDPLALLRSLPIAGEDQSSDNERDDAEPPRKRAKKWFEDDSEEEEKERKTKKQKKGGKKVIEMDHEPDNLEDLEALAAGLLED